MLCLTVRLSVVLWQAEVQHVSWASNGPCPSVRSLIVCATGMHLVKVQATYFGGLQPANCEAMHVSTTYVIAALRGCCLCYNIDRALYY